MDFDTAKENVQPLKHGRRADRLEVVLGENKELLELEKRQYEDAIKNYDGQDPLCPWYDYICWIQQSYPSLSNESGLDEIVSQCIVNFEGDERYHQDRRMVKLFIKYIDSTVNPQEAYLQLYNNGIGTKIADLYIAWSYYYDAIDDVKNAEKIFQKGFDAHAEPLDELKHAHQQFNISVSRRLLYDDDGSKEQFKASLEERRNALTLLQPHNNKYVGSLRTGAAVRNDFPGTVVNQENMSCNTVKNAVVTVHDEELEGKSGSTSMQPTTSVASNVSVIKNILNSAKKKENTREPGPWTKARSAKKGCLFGKMEGSNQSRFDIPEDENNLSPIPYSDKLFDKGIQLPSNWTRKNSSQQTADWNIAIVLEEPRAARSIPAYDKCRLYPDSKTEISPEEFRAYLWCKKSEIQVPLVKENDKYWKNSFEYGIRLYPGFSSSNDNQNEKINFPLFIESEEESVFQFLMNKHYPNNGEEFSREELMEAKWKKGEIKILTEQDFDETEELDDDMDLTIIGNRRESIYPCTSRKSIVPRKSIASRKSILSAPKFGNLTEEEENSSRDDIDDDSPIEGIQISNTKKRRSEEGLMPAPAPKKELIESPPSQPSLNEFKTPAPVEKKFVKPFQFEVNEDEVGCNPNDTCSTQQFNFFLKAQLASTPVSKKTSCRIPEPELESEEKEKPIVPEQTPEKEQTTPATPLTAELRKQLSTIMETSEPTHSSKLSTNQTSSYESDAQTPSPNQNTDMMNEIEKRMFVPLMTSFKLPEDQTDTCAKINPIKMSRIDVPAANISELKLATSFKTLNIVEPDLTNIDSSLAVPEDMKVSNVFVPAPQNDFKVPQESFVVPPEIEITDTATTINSDPLILTSEQLESMKNKSEKAEISAKLSFDIYEDSLVNKTKKIVSQNFQIGDEGTATYLHASRKENFIQPPSAESLTAKRTPSDEFLDLLKSPSSEKLAKNVDYKKSVKETSDFMKFSQPSIELSMQRLSVEHVKSPSPTANLFDDELNTERFTLGGMKNSTLIPDQNRQQKKESLDLNLSLEIHEDERKLLKNKKPEPEFKVPEIPVPLKVVKAPTASFDIYQDEGEGDEDEEEDLSKTIYAERQDPVEDDLWEEERCGMASFIATDHNQYEHTIISNEDMSDIVRQTIADSNGNPFEEIIREKMLEYCNFTSYLESNIKTCSLVKIVPQLRVGMSIDLAGGELLTVQKLIGKGSYASVFSAKSTKSDKTCAVKQQKPANLWEYYVCVEIMDRMKDKRMLPAFMSIDSSVIGNNSSIFVSLFSQNGTIIDICNKHKAATNRNIDEYVVMTLASQLLNIIDHLHSCKIIHGDVKPDNFLLMRKLEFGSKVPALQLIDFGCAIDLDWYGEDEAFTYVVKTDNFTCCEMLEGKPWKFQIDLFGIAGTVFVMLFGKYMEVEKRHNEWKPKTKFPRYFNKILWEQFFDTLLNIPNCKTMPNLQHLRSTIEEEIYSREKFVRDKINEFNLACGL